MNESESTFSKWQKEHRDQLAAKGIDLPEEETTTFHCRRCHRNLPIEQYKPHYKACPGFASKCEKWNCQTWSARRPQQE